MVKMEKGGKRKVGAAGTGPTAATPAAGICDHIQSGLKTLALLLLLPPMLNYAGLKKEREYFESGAILFDIGFGQKMYMNCTGGGGVAPTIILDAPTGSTSDVWMKLQRELSDTATVCIYDRAGLGLSNGPPRLNASDPGEGVVLNTLGPQSTVVRMVSDLHRLVTFSHPLKRPFLLVGSELGSAVVRAYSHLHSEDVAGLILIDPLDSSLFNPDSVSTPQEKQDNPWINYWFSHIIITYRLLQLSAMSGLSRLGLLAGQLTLPNISDDDDVIARQKHQICDPFHMQAVVDEFSYINESLRQVDEISAKWPLPANITATIISGSYYDSELQPVLNRGWSMSVQTLIERIPGSKHVVISGGDRHTIYNNPEEIASVIKKVVKRLKPALSSTMES